MTTGRAGNRWPRGTSTVEFVIVLPVLLLVFLGITEFSRAWMYLNAVTMAAREAARVGTVTPAPWTDAAAKAKIANVLTPIFGTSQANAIASAATVTCAAPCEADSAVTATVGYTFTSLVPRMLPMLDGVLLAETAVMRYE